MGTAPLIHVYPTWGPSNDDPHAPEDEWCEHFEGRMRVVRNRKRAKLLRDRGVPMWRLPAVAGQRRYQVWFTTEGL